MPSKTQEAFERRDITALTRIGIRKCSGQHPPVSTDAGAKNLRHAHQRYKTNRYDWIQHWITKEFENPRPDDTGSRMMTRLRWRLKDEIRKEYATRRRIAKGLDRAESERLGAGRVRRNKLPPREEVLDYLSTLEPPTDPALRDLWERILDSYPNWRESTNRHLAVIYGVHPNVIASRRHALAALYAEEDGMQAYMLRQCLRVRIAKVRKTDLNRVESERGVIRRNEIVSKKRKVGEARLMDWHGKHGEGTPVMVPVYGSVERVGFFRLPRCPHVQDGRQCIYSQAKCPTHRAESTI